MAHLSGFNPYKPAFRFDCHRMSHFVIQLIAIIMTAFSIVHEWPNKTEIVKVSMGIGIFTQSIVKAFLMVYHGESFEVLKLDVEKMFKLIEIKDEKRRKVLRESVKTCETIFKILFVVDTSAVVTFFIYPAIALVFLKTQYLMFPFYFPFVDRTTQTGFLFNSVIHGILLVYTLLFHNSFDTIFSLYVMQVITKVKLIKIEFEELQEKIEARKNVDRQEIKQKLRNIIIQQQELDAYVEKLSEFYLKPCFVTSVTSIFSICLALVLMIIVNWVLAYGLAWALSGQLFVYFLFGTIIYHQFEVLNRHISNTPWYLLDTVEQRFINMMILKTQRPLNLEMVFIGVLNMETFTNVSFLFSKMLFFKLFNVLQICNAIYSFYMIFNNFLMETK